MIVVLMLVALATGAVARSDNAAAASNKARVDAELSRANITRQAAPGKAIRDIDSMDMTDATTMAIARAARLRVMALCGVAVRTTDTATLSEALRDLRRADLTDKTSIEAKAIKSWLSVGISREQWKGAVASGKVTQREIGLVEEAIRLLRKWGDNTAMQDMLRGLLQAIPQNDPLLLRNRQNVFRRLYAALHSRDWKAFDDLAPVAVEHNYLHARYLLLVSEYARGNFARVIEIADEYNSTIAPDELSDGYHRESHLWADVYKWRSQKALGRLEDAAATAARVNAEWPNSAWAKAMR